MASRFIGIYNVAFQQLFTEGISKESQRKKAVHRYAFVDVWKQRPPNLTGRTLFFIVLFQLVTIFHQLAHDYFKLCFIKSKHLNPTTNSGGNFRGPPVIKLGGRAEYFLNLARKSFKALQWQVHIGRNQL